MSDKAIIVKADILLPSIRLATIDIIVKASAFGLLSSTRPSQADLNNGDVNAKLVMAGKVVNLSYLGRFISGVFAPPSSLVANITLPFTSSLAISFLDDISSPSYLLFVSLFLASI